MLAHTDCTLCPKLAPTYGVVGQPAKRVDKGVEIVCGNKDASTCPLDHFCVGPPPWCDDGDATGHRLEQRHTFRVVVDRRDRKDVKFLQESNLLLAVHRAFIADLLGQSPGPNLIL